MNKHTSIFILLTLLVFCILLNGCIGANSDNDTHSTASQSEHYPQGKGFAYQDKDMNCLFVIQDENWACEKSPEQNSVFFYMKDDDIGSQNAITLFSLKKLKDVDTQIDTIWSNTQNLLSIQKYDENAIFVGEKYDGKEYRYSLTDNSGEDYEGVFVVWYNDDTIYILTTTTNEKMSDRVNMVYNSIIDSFCEYTG